MPPKRPDGVQTAIYAWPEPPVTTSSVGKHYNSIVRDVDGRVTVFRVGDVALFEAEGSHVPYVGLIEKLWETDDMEMMLCVRWFYRPEDCPSNVPMPVDMRDNELFFSNAVRKDACACRLLGCVDGWLGTFPCVWVPWCPLVPKTLRFY